MLWLQLCGALCPVQLRHAVKRCPQRQLSLRISNQGEHDKCAAGAVCVAKREAHIGQQVLLMQRQQQAFHHHTHTPSDAIPRHYGQAWPPQATTVRALAPFTQGFGKGGQNCTPTSRRVAHIVRCEWEMLQETVRVVSWLHHAYIPKFRPASLRGPLGQPPVPHEAELGECG